MKKTSSLPAVVQRTALPAAPIDATRLLEAFLRGRNQQTLRAYGKDLDDLAAFLGETSREGVARRLLGGTAGEANNLVLAYRDQMIERGLSPATVNRRLAAVRSMVRLGRMLGLVPWAIEIPGVRSQTYRDTRGPGREAYLSILDSLYAEDGVAAVRDRALVRLLHDLGLRRGEVTGLRLEDIEPDWSRLWVLRKGRAQREWKTLPDPVADALKAWVEKRGRDAGPLFRNAKGGPLSEDGIYKIVRRRGEALGIKVRPHGLRHTAVTEVGTTQGLLKAQKFAGHADPRTTMRYIDAATDEAGAAAKAISPPAPKKDG